MTIAFRAGLVLALALTPTAAHAWGFAAHRLIMTRAIDLLPQELKPFFERYRDEVVVRVVDPDTWRTVGWEEDPNHFLDFGVPEYGPYPFAALPRDYGAAIEKFGTAALKRNGLLPWREAEEFGNLRRAFEEAGRGSQYAVSNVVLLAAVASHYVQDATQPLHATDNYDGQRSGQRGLHARFERDLIERFGTRIRLEPSVPGHIAAIRDFMFDTLLKSYQLVESLLRADKEAVAGRTEYDDTYFETFFLKVKPMLEAQLSAAATATAAVIVSAWEQAGKPTIRLQDARPLQKVPL
jgi:hypothetical protein